jgi:hypothetical protein
MSTLIASPLYPPRPRSFAIGSVETDFPEQGARSQHRLDVSVRFARFGLKQHWVVECKLWNRRVSKLAVLALQKETPGHLPRVLRAEPRTRAG